jgi:hypothetical protein
MAFYQYYCENNKLTVEVNHPMAVRFKTWGEVCKSAGIALGGTPSDAPVIRLISGSALTSWRLKGLDKDTPSDRLIM